MDYYGTVDAGKAYLEHFGIKGMRWGVRRFENPDGTLTEAGKKRYRKKQFKKAERLNDRVVFQEMRNGSRIIKDRKARMQKAYKAVRETYGKEAEQHVKNLHERNIGTAIAGPLGYTAVALKQRRSKTKSRGKYDVTTNGSKLDKYNLNKTRERLELLQGSTQHKLQIRKLGAGNYIVEPVDPSQRKRIYKTGTVVK